MAFDLKDEKSVKEYLDKLGVEYRFGCFSEKNPEACHLLGDYLEAVKKDYEKAAKIYKNNCEELSHPKSCYKIGNYTLLGKGREQEDPKLALKYFNKGCELNDADACLHSGLMLLTNEGFNQVDYDLRKAMENLNKSCDGYNANACHYLSGMYISGVKKGGIKSRIITSNSTSSTPDSSELKPIEYDLQKDMTKAFSYAQKACNLKNMYACANLSQMYARGEGTSKNLDLAEKYKAIAMELQDEFRNKKQTLTFQEGIKQTPKL